MVTKPSHFRVSGRKKKLSLSEGDTNGDCRIQFGEVVRWTRKNRELKAHKAYYNKLHFVANAQQGIPSFCPCGSITKEIVDEEDNYDYLPGKRYFICKDFENDGMHFRQPWVSAIQEEVERMKLRAHDHEKVQREVESLKGQVRLLLMRVGELERQLLK